MLQSEAARARLDLHVSGCGGGRTHGGLRPLIYQPANVVVSDTSAGARTRHAVQLDSVFLRDAPRERGDLRAARILGDGFETPAERAVPSFFPATTLRLGGAGSPAAARTPRTSNTGIVAPTSATICDKIPPSGAGTSTFAFSVSSSQSGSPSWTWSPSCLNQRRTFPSCIPMPNWGSRTSVAILFPVR